MRTERGWAAFLLMLAACGDASAPEARASASQTASVRATSTASAVASSGESYSCPMHPEVRQAGPGKCPLCGMNLEKDSAPVATTPPSATASSVAAADGSGYRITLQAAPLKVGSRAEVELSLFDPEGKALAEADFRIAHERRIHLLIIDESLTDYHHEHPTPASTGKTLKFGFTPRKPGKYRVFADVMPEATKRHLYLMSDLSSAAAGEPITGRDAVLKTEVDGYGFELHLLTTPKQGSTLDGELFIRDRDGAVVKELEPVMGAYAHLVGFFDDRVTVEHIHPLGAEPTRQTDRGGGKLSFRVTPTKSGLMRLFAQVKIGGVERFAPFTLQLSAK